jgi:hypothetical protein
MKTPTLETRRHGATTRYLYDSCTIGAVEHRKGQLFVTTAQGYLGNQWQDELFTITTAKALMWEHSCVSKDAERSAT